MLADLLGELRGVAMWLSGVSVGCFEHGGDENEWGGFRPCGDSDNEKVDFFLSADLIAGGTPWGGDVAEWGGFHPFDHGDDLSGVALMLLGMLIMRMRMSFCLCAC